MVIYALVFLTNHIHKEAPRSPFSQLVASYWYRHHVCLAVNCQVLLPKSAKMGGRRRPVNIYVVKPFHGVFSPLEYEPTAKKTERRVADSPTTLQHELFNRRFRYVSFVVRSMWLSGIESEWCNHHGKEGRMVDMRIAPACLSQLVRLI